MSVIKRLVFVALLCVTPYTLKSSEAGVRIESNQACAQDGDGCRCGAGSGYCGVIPHSKCWTTE